MPFLGIEGGVYHHDQSVGMAGRKIGSQHPGRAGQQRLVIAIGEVRIDLVQAVGNRRGIRPREGQNLHRPIPGDLHFFTLVLFEHHMKITAAESEGTDTAASRMVGFRKPGPQGGVQIKRAGLNFQLRIRVVRLERRWKNFVIEG